MAARDILSDVNVPLFVRLVSRYILNVTLSGFTSTMWFHRRAAVIQETDLNIFVGLGTFVFELAQIQSSTPLCISCKHLVNLTYICEIRRRCVVHLLDTFSHGPLALLFVYGRPDGGVGGNVLMSSYSNRFRWQEFDITLVHQSISPPSLNNSCQPSQGLAILVKFPSSTATSCKRSGSTMDTYLALVYYHVNFTQLV
jgi:hypothetical protein